ncbi:hypothetical protein CC99x_004925 [Candidatus Berkiella cookevillensis]|uniref:Uncharacterized protein n=1 Tax=Candidatus Berkiella cookevillensis TaxID=437022 RepID=A0A0Q9YHS1_9GAMM|nr:hypothetical protein [Candidatus Berkiella cookevillensis]MCS5708242.1 hypothetical protein [Candidatus Berkiella cookevillensis]
MRDLINNEVVFVSGGNGEELRVSTTDTISHKLVYNEIDPVMPSRVVRFNNSIVEPASAFYNEEDVA